MRFPSFRATSGSYVLFVVCSAVAPLLLCVDAGHAQSFNFHHAVVPPPGSGFLEGKTGWTLAVSADHVVAGAPLANDAGRVLVWSAAGAVSGSDLSYAVFDDPGPGLPGLFGASLACEGNMIAVGHCSALADGYCDEFTDHVSLFEKVDGAWSALPNIARPAWALGTFGHALAIHGDRLAIGAYRSTVPGAEFPIVYLYRRSDGQWPALPTDSLSGSPDGADRFGTALAMDDEHLLIGAYRDGDLGEMAGAAYIYRPDQDSADHWVLRRKLLASNGTANDGFGRAVVLAGDQCSVGAPFRLVDTLVAGTAYHFMRDMGFPDNWGEAQMLLPSAPHGGMAFGESLALKDDVLAIGAPKDALTFPGQSGSLELFTYNGDLWTSLQHVSPTDDGLVSLGSQCARSLAFADGALIVGVPWAQVPGQTTATSGGLLVYTNEPIGMHDNTLSELSLWPVPARDRLFVELASPPVRAIRCTLHDALGRSMVIQPEHVTSTTLSFSVAGLPPGIWSISLTDPRNGGSIARGAFVRE